MEKPTRVQSNRGKYVVSKALYLGIKKLSKDVAVFPKDEEAKKDLQDMQDLYNNMYDSYIPIQGWGEIIQQPINITNHLHKQGGYYGT